MDRSGGNMDNLHGPQVDQDMTSCVRLRSSQEDSRMLLPTVVDRIRELVSQGWGSKRIARELRISRNTVRRYLAGATVGFQERLKSRRPSVEANRNAFSRSIASVPASAMWNE